MDVLSQVEELLLENHKAHWCPYDGLFCQEGYCEDCGVYQIWKEKSEKQAGRSQGVLESEVS